MTDEIVKKDKELTDFQKYSRTVHGMTNRQFSGHLRKVAKKDKRNTWAAVLSIVFDNTASTGMGGTLSHYLQPLKAAK